MNFTPIGAGVLLRQAEAKTTTEGGIHIPNASQRKEHRGIVMAVGPKVMDLKVDDVVMFPPSAARTIKLNDEDFVLIGEINIIGIYTDADGKL